MLEKLQFTASRLVRTEYEWGEVECALSLKSHFRNSTMTGKSFFPPTYIFECSEKIRKPEEEQMC